MCNVQSDRCWDEGPAIELRPTLTVRVKHTIS